ncbi:MAG: GNAT family N-acetyltransferase [Caulobacteraceae bacterium]|nr:GNAT family N-acetyltransferase [Caulobacteraceae bacterium]
MSLDTERLTLRRHTLDDFKDVLELWADPEVVKYISGQPLSEEDCWAKFLRMAGHWSMLGFGYWVVREKATGRFVGEVGFGDFKRELSPPFEGAPEAGWALARWAQGRGYAAEAVRAALRWGEDRFGKVRMVCLISPENIPSLRLAEAVGFRPYADSTYKGHATRLHERLPA